MPDLVSLIAAFVTSVASIILLGEVLRKSERRKLLGFIRKLGEEQGLAVSEGLKTDGFQYDIAWRREIDGKPTHVFIVRKGEPLEAMAGLKHAFDLWKAKGFYISDVKEVEEASRLLKGSFHEVDDQIWLLTFKDLKEIVKLKSRYSDLLDKLKPSHGPVHERRVEDAVSWRCYEWMPPLRR